MHITITTKNGCSKNKFSGQRSYVYVRATIQKILLYASMYTMWIPEMTKTLILVQNEAPQKDLRPRHKRLWRGEPKSALTIFVRTLLGKLSWKNEWKMGHTKIVRADLNSPRQELSVRGLGFVVSLPFWGGINFLYASKGQAIQL